MDNRRTFVFWDTLERALRGRDDPGQRTTRKELADALDMPALLLDDRATVSQVARRMPGGEVAWSQLLPAHEDSSTEDDDIRRLMLWSKLLVNVLGSDDGSEVTLEGYSDWQGEVERFEEVYADGAGMGLGDGGKQAWGPGGGHGGGPEATTDDINEALREIERGQGLMSAPAIEASLKAMDKRMLERMSLFEILKDPAMAAKLTPSMALTEQLLRGRGKLDGAALASAKRLIQRYVDQLHDAMKKELKRTSKGRPDPKIPPKRVFRNLDLDRTIWQNLTNWDPENRRLLVDRLYYRRTATHEDAHRLIVVVDQSGSMVSAMVNCTILASIFAGMARIDVHLFAYDTEVVDLTPYANDPMEALLRTQLGGGNDGPVAMTAAAARIADPRKTVMVWISDFYERRELFPMVEAVVRSGVTFIPVGAVSSSGYFSVDDWFRKQFESLGTPVVSGSLKTLVRELRAVLP